MHLKMYIFFVIYLYPLLIGIMENGINNDNDLETSIRTLFQKVVIIVEKVTSYRINVVLTVA